jgi:hypothetical protein
VVASLGADGAVAVLFVIGRYLAHAAFVNALGIGPPVPSVFDDGFGLDAAPEGAEPEEADG